MSTDRGYLRIYPKHAERMEFDPTRLPRLGRGRSPTTFHLSRVQTLNVRRATNNDHDHEDEFSSHCTIEPPPFNAPMRSTHERKPPESRQYLSRHRSQPRNARHNRRSACHRSFAKFLLIPSACLLGLRQHNSDEDNDIGQRCEGK